MGSDPGAPADVSRRWYARFRRQLLFAGVIKHAGSWTLKVLAQMKSIIIIFFAWQSTATLSPRRQRWGTLLRLSASRSTTGQRSRPRRRMTNSRPRGEQR